MKKKYIAQLITLLDVVKNHKDYESIISDARLLHRDYECIGMDVKEYLELDTIELVHEWLDEGLITEEDLTEFCVAEDERIVNEYTIDSIKEKIDEIETEMHKLMKMVSDL